MLITDYTSIKKIVLTVLILFSFSISVFAHSGRTDSAGGHYDRSTGEYHYHHGYPEHQHKNGECPYDFDDEKATNNRVTESPKDNSYISLIVNGSIALVIVILIVLSFKTNGRSTEILFEIFCIVMSSPYLIIWALYLAIAFLVKKIRFALPLKSMYKYKMLDRCWIDIDKVNKRYKADNSEYSKFIQRKYCEKIAECEKYIFYRYLSYSDGSSGYILRQDKNKKDNVVFFGNNARLNVVFHNYLFQSHSNTYYISSTDVDNGFYKEYECLSKNQIMYVAGWEGVLYYQDSIKKMYIEDDKLILDVSRKKSHFHTHTDKYDMDLSYKIIFSYNNYSFEYKIIMPNIT